MNKQKKTLDITILDNGIVIDDTDTGFSECETFSEEEKAGIDTKMNTFVGSHIWPEIYRYFEEKLTTKIKLTMTLETKSK